MWVGKFETGYKGASSKEEAQKNENNSSKIQIKPNVYSWRGINVANAHLNSYDYKREYESHMMKNTEWGAVAYLQHSKYGSKRSVRINNNDQYLTGYAAVHEPTTGYTGTNISCTSNPDACNEYGHEESITKPWNTSVGVLASTTGNISGIYDMSGGAWEYVMGVMLSKDNQTPCSGLNDSDNSGFAGRFCNDSETGSLASNGENDFPDLKYYDTYLYAMDDEHFNRRILGDATGEVGSFAAKTYKSQTRKISSWYQDEAWFIRNGVPWFTCGGSLFRGNGSGVFAFNNYYGHGEVGGSFRVVLSV